MSRNIRVALTHDEYIALRGCVAGELESLTERDWESGLADDLQAAAQQLERAWSLAALRSRKRVDA